MNELVSRDHDPARQGGRLVNCRSLGRGASASSVVNTPRSCEKPRVPAERADPDRG